jgi:hypothetical protein
LEEQEKYKDWFWSNLDEEASNQKPGNLNDLTILEAIRITPGPLPTESDNFQLTDQLTQIRQAVEVASKAAQEEYIEIIRGAAAIFVLQGDLRSARVCQTLENLIANKKLPDDLGLGKLKITG